MERCIPLEDGDRAEVHRIEQLVSCFWCGCIHRAKHPLSVCPTCVGRYRTLRQLEMHGSDPLDAESIDEVMSRTSIGNYALGYMNGGVRSASAVGER